MPYKDELQDIIRVCCKVITAYLAEGHVNYIAQWLFNHTDYHYRHRRGYYRTEKLAVLASDKLCTLADLIHSRQNILNKVPMLTRRNQLMTKAISFVENNIQVYGPLGMDGRPMVRKVGYNPLYTVSSFFSDDALFVKVYFFHGRLMVEGSLTESKATTPIVHRFDKLHEKDICRFADYLQAISPGAEM